MIHTVNEHTPRIGRGVFIAPTATVAQTETHKAG